MQAMVNFEVERLIACAQSLGAAECAFEDADALRNTARPVRQAHRQQPAHSGAHHRDVHEDRKHAQLGVQDRMED